MVRGFLAAAVRVATPLLLAATGETITERSGVINLGLEGMMLAGALAATIGATASWGPWTGVVVAVVAGMLLAAVFALHAIGARADQIIAGTAITLAAVGLTGTIYRQAYGSGGAGLGLPTLDAVAIPVLGRIPVLGTGAVRPACPDLHRAARLCRWSGGSLFRTRLGLALRATGEAAAAGAGGGRAHPAHPHRARRSWAAGSRVSPGRRWCWRRSARSRRR